MMMRLNSICVQGKPVVQEPFRPPEPWRRVYKNDFEMAEKRLKDELRKHRATPLNIVLIGHTGAGKSSLINSIFSISRGQIVNICAVKADNHPGIGTFHFLKIKARQSDLFDDICIFDTMGFTDESVDVDDGITPADLEVVCQGRIRPTHRFNKDTPISAVYKKYIPHCVIFVISAEELDRPIMRNKIKALSTKVTNDSAKIAVITNVDRVCGDTHRDPENIYTSTKIHSLVKRAQKVFGVNENEVFPIINLVTGVEVDNAALNVPILYAIKFAVNFARDRHDSHKEWDKDKEELKKDKEELDKNKEKRDKDKE